MDIVGIMEEWARWMVQRNFHGWPAKTILGRCLDDMPSTRCTVCSGRGKIPGHEVGSSREFIKCDVCKGLGKVPMTASSTKINPALIAGTERFARIPKVQFNFVAHIVDNVVQELPENLKNVAYTEYQEPGSQYKKARIIGIPQQTYSHRLQKVHRIVANSFDRA